MNGLKEIPDIATKEYLHTIVGKQRNLLHRWLKLIREPSSEDVHVLEQETAEEVGEFANQSSQRGS